MKPKPSVLLVDDRQDYARAIEAHLGEFELVDVPEHRGLRRAPDGPSALRFLERHAAEVSLVVLDLHFDLPAESLLGDDAGENLRRRQRYEGLEIHRRIRASFPRLPVLLLTSRDDIALGEFPSDALEAPLTFFLENDDLETLRVRMHAALKSGHESASTGGIYWGHGAAMGQVRRRVRLLSRGSLPLVLEGETGTGKSFLARRFLHPATGRKGPFVTLDLSTIPSDLISAHLFGATKGAYTGAIADRTGVFEAAHGGTLFIDEIQNAPASTQKQLLVVLQERTVTPLGSTREIAVDVKVVAGSNQSLERAVAEGTFRQDLAMRLGISGAVTLPALRNRREDILPMAEYFVAQAAAHSDHLEFIDRLAGSSGKKPKLRLTVANDAGTQDALELVVPKPVLSLLEAYDWPGNARELQMFCHQLVTIGLLEAVEGLEGKTHAFSGRVAIDIETAQRWLRPRTPINISSVGDVSIVLKAASTLNQVAVEVERQYMLDLFRRTRGDLAAMAERLLDDPSKDRAVRLRLNQIGLKIRELRAELDGRS